MTERTYRHRLTIPGPDGRPAMALDEPAPGPAQARLLVLLSLRLAATPPPGLKELAGYLGCSHANVETLLKRLRRAGRVSWQPNAAGTLRVTAPARWKEVAP